jgi:NAD(P)H-hydrate epimerase
MSLRPVVLTRDQVREVDRRAINDYGLIGLVLMENAGRNAAALLLQLGITGSVVICCGTGNNAGDGFVIARHLENAGIDVTILLAVPSSGLAGDAAVNFHILQRAGMRIVEPPPDGPKSLWSPELAGADWIVDAMLGTGTQGSLREPYLTAISTINASGRKVFAVDLPSGMDCDTGQPLGDCIRAQHTATFVALKPGFNSPPAANFTGQVHVIDIGVPRRLLDELAAGD